MRSSTQRNNPMKKAMNKPRCAVIGVGSLGKYHAEKFAMLDSADFVAICDTDEATRQSYADKYNVAAYANYRDLLGKVDAVSIATPTSTHFDISQFFLDNNIHVLVEKPMTQTVSEANKLIEIAKKNRCTFQVGHIERFNAAHMALDKVLQAPKFIDSNRLSPFNLRNLDVSVILDLMIHDIDIIQNMVNSPIKELAADGTPVLSNTVDIASARIKFENGCVANVTASRISFKSERKTRIFQPNAYISIDYQNKQFVVFRKSDTEMYPGIPDINKEEFKFDNTDALKLEIEAFLQSIAHNTPPVVTGEDGKNALATAIRITDMIHANLADLVTA